MFDASKRSIWYGNLETASSKTPVIYDPGLPEPPRGQIYLYNSERDAILKYAAHIVQPLLRDYDNSERKKIEKSLTKKWQAARKTFLREYGGRPSVPRTRASVKRGQKVVQPEIDSSDGDDQDYADDVEDFDSA